MNWIEVASYVAPALVFCSFFMKDIVPLRLVAMTSNVAFITYAIGSGLTPVLVLHSALLPLNILRVVQFRQLQRRVRDAIEGTAVLASIVPLMNKQFARAGDVLFAKDDDADMMFFVEDGEVTFPEVGATVGPGAVFGEIALFLDGEGRTATARCLTDCRLRTLSRKRVQELAMIDPAFGLFLTKLIATRMNANANAVPS